VVGWHNRLLLWDLVKQQERKDFGFGDPGATTGAAIESVAFSPDGKYLAAGTAARNKQATVKIWKTPPPPK